MVLNHSTFIKFVPDKMSVYFSNLSVKLYSSIGKGEFCYKIIIVLDKKF